MSESQFLKNAWYVWGWARDIPEDKPAGRIIIGQPVVVWRSLPDKKLLAAEDRCPHRHAPLSLGRITDGGIRCMYHGMQFGNDGRCQHMPLMDTPPNASIRMYPVVEKDSWIWVWMGDPANADESQIPDAFGIDDPDQPMLASSIEYDANYQLLHDNLCDLSHVDYVHETTLQVASGNHWARSTPNITLMDRRIRIERWFENADRPGGKPGEKVDTWSAYDFVVPGLFILRGARFPVGTAKACDMKEPVGIEPLSRNIEQQAVTPIDEHRTAYHFATGLIGSTPEMTRQLATRMDVVKAAFDEDRQMIEAQQVIWKYTDKDKRMMAMPQDKAPALMRNLMARLIREESASGA